MVDVPKFNFNNTSIKSEAELKEKLDSDSKSDKYFKPGRHEVQITGLEYKGPAGDPNWGKFVVTVKGTGEKTTTGMIFVPFKDVMYKASSGKDTVLFYKRFLKFMTSAGLPVTVETLSTVVPETFSKPDKSPLIGANIAMDLGYDGNYIKYDGKDEIGNKRYVVTMADESTLVDTKTGKTAIFSDYDSAAAHCEQYQIKLQRFAQILDWSVSSTPRKSAAAGNW